VVDANAMILKLAFNNLDAGEEISATCNAPISSAWVGGCPVQSAVSDFETCN